jgi:hypothetical protein
MSANISFVIPGPGGEKMKEDIRGEAIKLGKSLSELMCMLIAEYMVKQENTGK